MSTIPFTSQIDFLTGSGVPPFFVPSGATKVDNLDADTVDGVHAAGFAPAPTSAGISGTRQFYAASSSGGAVDQLHTVVLSNGIITDWLIGPLGNPGQWDFTQTAQSGQLLTAGF